MESRQAEARLATIQAAMLAVERMRAAVPPPAPPPPASASPLPAGARRPKALAAGSGSPAAAARAAIAASELKATAAAAAAAAAEAAAAAAATAAPLANGSDDAGATGAEVASEADPAHVDPDDGYMVPAPIVQVGESRFHLPPPALAVQRIAELWKPGALMVVITTDHYGTPLLCPDGDISRGLINIAPSAEGGQQLVPLFWENVDAQEGSSDPESIAKLVAMERSGFRHPRPQLPTMVEEEEEEEDEEENARKSAG